MKKIVVRENRYFRFLERLRAGGRSNMYGAIPYLSDAFGCDRNEAFRIVCEWIDAERAFQPEAERPELRRQVIAPLPAVLAPSLFDAPPLPVAPAVLARKKVVSTSASASRASRPAVRKKADKGRKTSRGKAA